MANRVRRANTRTPLLLRRALAQLRDDPPAGWPNVTRTQTPEPGTPYGSEVYGSHYPFPTLAKMMPHLGNRATQAELRRMIERLEKAPIGTAWSTLAARCAAMRRDAPRCAAMSRDAGEIVMMALAEALVPFNVTDQANTTEALKRVQDAAGKLAATIEALGATGAPLDWLAPR